MEVIKSLQRRFDVSQKKHPVLGFPVAVILKFSTDQAGNQAALLTYYGFLSLFPLLLVFFTLLPLVFAGDLAVQQRITQAIFDYFPIVGADLQENIHKFRGSGWGLVAGILFALYGAHGAANILQSVTNHIWGIPKEKQPGFPWSTLRSLGIIIVGGIGLVITTGILGYVTGIWDSGLLGKLLVTCITLGLNTIIFLVIARLATASEIPTPALLLGAGTSAVLWQLLQMTGSFLVLHQLKTASALYGMFAIVLGLLFWLYLQARLYLFVLEISVVKHKRSWPKSIVR